tara:strand:+ start:560 stop:1045 length:486 start_codon:yes stop_codon:yes gene_type:complete
MIKIRATLESKEDVIRELVINEDLTLDMLHFEIIKKFNLDRYEMASFYQVDSELNLEKEYSLIDTNELEQSNLTMNKVSISSVLFEKKCRLIYIHDFLKMWRFYIEYVEQVNSKEKIYLSSIGKMPNEAPEIIFKSENKIRNSVSFESQLDKEDEFSEYEY